MKSIKIQEFKRKNKEIDENRREIEHELKNFCKNKKFKIIDDLYYSGFQNNLKGRVCTLEPHCQYGEILFMPTVYNKKTKKIDIIIYRGYGETYFEELESDEI